MKWITKTWLLVSTMLASALSAAEPDAIAVFVYNYAEIPADSLAKTKLETSRIYRHSGIEIQWLDCATLPKYADRYPACDVPPGPLKLAIRLLPRSMSDRFAKVRDQFGFTLLPTDGNFATVANVFAHHSQQIANRHRIRLEVMLGHIMAHEIGHLLLGSGSHSPTGLMHAPWLPGELERAAQGSMQFSADESRKMRADILARKAAEGATATLCQ